jgi:hypothetical protein
VGGQTKQERRLVARKRISAGLEMGRLEIPPIDENIKGLQENLRIYRQNRANPSANPPSSLPHAADYSN